MEAHTSGDQPFLNPTDFPSLPSLRSTPSSTPLSSVPLLPKPVSSSSALPNSTPVSISPVENPLQDSQTKASSHSSFSLWKDLFGRNPSALKSFPSPSFTPDGVPVVKAPPSVLLKSSETWKDHLICHFFGDPPALKKIFQDLNPIWGKRGTIQVHYYTDKSCFIFIPNSSTREWVLDVGFWSAGMVTFAVSLWTPTSSLSEQVLSSAPVWLTLQGTPPQLWSPEGFSLIASGVGSPLPPATSALFPKMGVGAPRIRAVVPLDKGPLPTTVIVEDAEGNRASIGIKFENLPPLCPVCSLYGHRSHRCPRRSSAPPSSKPPATTRSASNPACRVGHNPGRRDASILAAESLPMSVQVPASYSPPSDEDLGFVQSIGLPSPNSGPIAPSSNPTLSLSLPSTTKPTSPPASTPNSPIAQKPNPSLEPTSSLPRSIESPIPKSNLSLKFRPISPNSLRPKLPSAAKPYQSNSSRPSSPSVRKPPSQTMGQVPSGPTSTENSPQPNPVMLDGPTCVETPISPVLPAGSPISSSTTSPPPSRQLIAPHRLPFSPPPPAFFTSLLRQVEYIQPPSVQHVITDDPSTADLEDGEISQGTFTKIQDPPTSSTEKTL